METSEIKVSICCLTYNHEKYVRQALDSFLMQNTNFKYEILIHDDASTDGTADIIREYESKYPDIIKPIYQKENQYSQRVKINWTYQYPRAKGKYIATCEGDDFWCDEHKLQRQYEALENSGSVFCAHQVRFVTESGDKTDKKKPDDIASYCQLGEEFLKTLLKGKICPFQTSSFMFERNAILEAINKIPEFVRVSRVGDVNLMMLLATKGSICYLNKEMSCYRMFSVSSWSLRQKQDINRRIQHEENLCEVFKAFNIYTNMKYADLIQDQINKRKFNLMIMQGQYDEIFKQPFRSMMRQLTLKERVYIVCSAKMPYIMKVYKKLKNQLKR